MTTFTNNTNTKPVAWLEKQLNVSVMVYILLSMVTCGIYSLMVSFRITRHLTTLSQDIGDNRGRLRKLLLINVFGALGYFVFMFVGSFMSAPVLVILSFLCLIASTVTGIWWIYEARAMMMTYYAKAHGFPMQINGFLAFFFSNIMLLLAANSAERTQQLHKHVR